MFFTGDKSVLAIIKPVLQSWVLFCYDRCST